MKYFSLFSGVGGFEIGIEKAYAAHQKVEAAPAHHQTVTGGQETEHGAGVDTEPPQQSGSHGTQNDERPTCVGMSEIDKHASAVLRYRYPNVKNYGDITKIDWSSVPDFDLLVGGSPCQDFSIAGKRAGIAGKRSGLFGHYRRALEEKKPSHFIWENVKGVLSSNGGKDFGFILDSLAEAGYSLTWQVLNAKDFGVPQNRERVFVVGTRGDSGREVFFEPGGREQSTIKNIFNGGSAGTRVYGTDGVGCALSANGGGHGAKTGLIAYGTSQDQKLNPLDSVCQTLSAGHYNQPKITEENRIRRLTPR